MWKLPYNSAPVSYPPVALTSGLSVTLRDRSSEIKLRVSREWNRVSGEASYTLVRVWQGSQLGVASSVFAATWEESRIVDLTSIILPSLSLASYTSAVLCCELFGLVSIFEGEMAVWFVVFCFLGGGSLESGIRGKVLALKGRFELDSTPVLAVSTDLS